MIQKKTFESSDSDMSRSGRYRPPHLRGKVVAHHKEEEGLIAAKHELTTSDSECCESDGSLTDNYAGPFVEARLAAILCIQVCKSFLYFLLSLS